jgi:hypothetical protein
MYVSRMLTEQILFSGNEKGQVLSLHQIDHPKTSTTPYSLQLGEELAACQHSADIP